MSLIRQGELNVETLTVKEKVWSEDSIRSLAFGETPIFERLPKSSYEDNPIEGDQLDMPMTPILFRAKCFTVPLSKGISEVEYDEILIKFYSQVAQDVEEVWSLKRIEKFIQIRKIDVFEGIFQNFQFKVLRSNNQESNFTLADLPVMNPSDLLRILKLLLGGVKFEVTGLLHHFRVMLRAYYQALAKHDVVIAKEVKLQVDRPMIFRDGLSKYTDGQILQEPVWGVIFKTNKNKKPVNAIMLLDDREKFTNEFIDGLIRRMALCEQNKDKDIQEVEKILTWMMVVRKVLLEVTYMIFIRR